LDHSIKGNELQHINLPHDFSFSSNPLRPRLLEVGTSSSHRFVEPPTASTCAHVSSTLQ
jgi:hypothetical protein